MSSPTDDRIENERTFHNAILESQARKKLTGAYSIAQASEDWYQNSLIKNSHDAAILEYGCGQHSYAAFAVQRGAKSVLGIDISDVAIEISNKNCRAVLAGDEAQISKLRFERMNAEALDVPDDQFDLVCGRAILHHLDFSKCFEEIHRVLKPGGKGIFVEPLGHNAFINWYRNRTPELRTPDEHPFMDTDFKQIEQVFSKVEVQYFHLTSLILIPMTKVMSVTPFVGIFDSIDKLLFKVFPFIRKQAWSCVITMTK